MSQVIIRLPDSEIASAFLEWLDGAIDEGAQVILIEGLLGSGKSYLLERAAVRANIIRIELDDFLPRPADQNVAWQTHAIQGGAIANIQSALELKRPLLVSGAVAHPIITRATHHHSMRRIYCKRMSRVGEYVDWLDGEGLSPHADRSPEYFRSIYSYHAAQPWLQADLVLERFPDFQ